MSRWYDNAVEQLETDLADGLISHEEFRAAMRDLNDELRGEAEENSAQAYRDTMGW
jgi:hypothetical protein